MDKNENKSNSRKYAFKLKSIFPLYYLPYSKIISIFKNNKLFMTILGHNLKELEKEYSKYYNLDTRKKLNSVIPLLESSLPTFLSKFNNNNICSHEKQLNDLCFMIAYSKIINKIIRLNKILLFKYTIKAKSTYNFNQLISIIMYMDYPKEIIFNINNMSLISENQFKILINKNYFTFGRNTKKMFVSIKESDTKTDETFLKFRNIAFEIFNNNNSNGIKIENLGYNFEDFFDDVQKMENNKVNLSHVNNIEISFCFTEEKKEKLKKLFFFFKQFILEQKYKYIRKK